MEIIWLGHSCFRLRGREGTVVADPYQSSIGYTIGKPAADVVTVSHDHPGHNNAPAVGGQPRVLPGPGEYEIKGIVITGITTYHDAAEGKERGKNTVYVVQMEDLVICHLGDIGHVPSTSQVDAMGDVDVLLAPVGGSPTLGAAQAAETISLLEPKIVIPMHYRTPAASVELEPVDRFLREMGVPAPEPLPRLSVTRANLPEETKVVLLEYRKG